MLKIDFEYYELYAVVFVCCFPLKQEMIVWNIWKQNFDYFNIGMCLKKDTCPLSKKYFWFVCEKLSW